MQRPEVLGIYARHYRCGLIEHAGIHLIRRSVRGVGTLRATAYSPEASRADWYQALADVPAGHVEVLTNAAAPPGAAGPVSAPDLHSFVIDLRQGRDALFASFRPQARKLIRRGLRLGASVRCTQDMADLAAFHAVLLRVTRGGLTYEAPALDLLAALLGSGFGRLYVLEHEGRIVGGQFLLVHRHAHAYVLAHDREACRGLTSSLLYWCVMQGEMEAGMPLLDLGTQSLSLHPGLVAAKSNFSPVLVPAYRYVLTPSRWRSAVDDGWRWLGQFLGRGAGAQGDKAARQVLGPSRRLARSIRTAFTMPRGTRPDAQTTAT